MITQVGVEMGTFSETVRPRLAHHKALFSSILPPKCDSPVSFDDGARSAFLSTSHLGTRRRYCHPLNQSVSLSVRLHHLMSDLSWQRTFATITMDITYGIPVTSSDDDYVVRMEQAAECFGKIKVPGAFWADIIPLLRYFPPWAPGGSSRRFGDRHRPGVLACKNVPFELVKQEMVSSPDNKIIMRIAHLTKHVYSAGERCQ